MIRTLFVLCTILSLSILWGCPKKQVIVAPKRKVLSYGKDHKAWRTISKRKIISPHHGNTEEEIFANGQAYRTSTGKQAMPYEEGSIFVMLRYKDGELQPLAYIMKKMDSTYHPNYNNWKYSTVRVSDWTIERDGKLADCITCHYKHTNRDFVPLMQKDGM